jgi:hypothetical protein
MGSRLSQTGWARKIDHVRITVVDQRAALAFDLSSFSDKFLDGFLNVLLKIGMSKYVLCLTWSRGILPVHVCNKVV